MLDDMRWKRGITECLREKIHALLYLYISSILIFFKECLIPFSHLKRFVFNESQQRLGLLWINCWLGCYDVLSMYICVFNFFWRPNFPIGHVLDQVFFSIIRNADYFNFKFLYFPFSGTLKSFTSLKKHVFGSNLISKKQWCKGGWLDKDIWV